MIFPLLALVLATLFTGAALYITLVEHPVRFGLGDGPALAQWQPSYERALPIQAGLVIVAGLCGIVAWFQLRDWQFLAASVIMLANWPYTLLAIFPTTKKLQAIAPQDAGPGTRALLGTWGRLHAGRSALGGVAVLLFFWGLAA